MTILTENERLLADETPIYNTTPISLPLTLNNLGSYNALSVPKNELLAINLKVTNTIGSPVIAYLGFKQIAVPAVNYLFSTGQQSIPANSFFIVWNCSLFYFSSAFRFLS